MTFPDDLFDDIETLDSEPPASPEYACQEEGCGLPLDYSGRGRKPKFCDEHKRRTNPRNEAGSTSRAPRRGAKLDARLAALEADLTREFTLFGKGLSGFLPVAGTTLVAKTPQTAAALTRIAGKNEKVLAALEVTSRVADAIDLGEAGAAFGVAILVDLNRVDPHSAISSMFGVAEVYDMVYPGDAPVPQQSQSQPVFNGFEVNVPPRFQPVGA